MNNDYIHSKNINESIFLPHYNSVKSIIVIKNKEKKKMENKLSCQERDRNWLGQGSSVAR
jgi:hypothetical protein